MAYPRQPTPVDKTNRLINQLLIAESLYMIVDKIWKLTNVVRVRLVPRSSHSYRQATFLDNVCEVSSPPLQLLCHALKTFCLSKTLVNETSGPKDRWVTKLTEERKRFYQSTGPPECSRSVTTNTSPHCGGQGQRLSFNGV